VAATAWEAAVLAAADSEAAGEVSAGAAEDGAGKRIIDEEKQMKQGASIMTSSKLFVITSAIVTGAFLMIGSLGAAEPKQKESTAPAPNQKQFDTPDQAADSLLAAAQSFDVPELTEILGPDSEDIISSEDPVMDKNRATAFAAKAKEKKSIEIDKKDPNRAILAVGNDDLTLPIPIVKRKGKWSFDTKVGREEILNRRIGSNELDAITICRGFDEAQHEYAEQLHDDSKVHQYAQKILSTPGKHDGLAWQNQDGTWGGPIGEDIAKALQEGYSSQGGKPYHGYYFKILTGHGPAAPMGEMDFVIKGAMIGGFALAAAPAEYRVTGVQTFIVGPNGVVYQKDLGTDTLKTFQGMDRYNPDKTWQETVDDAEEDSGD
jgi:hypothetical protein